MASNHPKNRGLWKCETETCKGENISDSLFNVFENLREIITKSAKSVGSFGKNVVMICGKLRNLASVRGISKY